MSITVNLKQFESTPCICEHCLYFKTGEKIKEIQLGTCQRRAPIIIQSHTTGQWPLVKETDTCGECLPVFKRPTSTESAAPEIDYATNLLKK